MTSIFSISADERDHITALTREFKPNNSFSSPDSLQNVKSNIFNCSRSIKNNAQVLGLIRWNASNVYCSLDRNVIQYRLSEIIV